MLLAGECDFKSKLECWSKFQNGYTVLKDDVTKMIRQTFEICIDMLKCFHKIRYEDVDLLTDEDYSNLK